MGGRLGVCLVALILSVSACGGEDASTTSTSSPPTGGTKPAVDTSATTTSAAAEKATTTSAELGFPRVYRGEGLYRLTIYRSGDDATFVCEQTANMELRLEADGTAIFTYFAGIGVVLSMDSAECNDAPGNSWTGTYDAGSGTFSMPPVSDTIESWDIGGSFDDRSAYGPMGYEYKTTIGDNYLTDSIVINFDLPLVP